MATKTVACPECGAPVVPGRYACAECGSLLAAVTASARTWGSEPEPEVTAGGPATDVPVVPVAVAPPMAAAAPAVGAISPNPEAHETAADSIDAAPGEDWDEPVTGAPAEPEPEPEPEPESEAPPDPAPVVDEVPSPPEPASAREPVEPAVVPPAVAPAPPAPSAWPPAGDRGVHPTPTARTPAGAYLPPSAVLDALDPASATGAAGGAPASSAAATPSAARNTPPSVKARGLLGSIDLGEDTPRAVVAVGAAIAAIGFLLPWANVLAGAGLLGGYFTQWGLAGPGHWIALTLLVAMVGVALAGPPTARWPVGLGAVALAALLVGMMWPYLFGFLGRSIGIWVVLAGAIVLAVGGVLDRLPRHDPDGPAVP